MRIVVRVKPGSSKGPLIEQGENELIVHVKEKAIDGDANEGVIKALSEHFDVAKSRITIVRGHTGRIKQVDVDI